MAFDPSRRQLLAGGLAGLGAIGGGAYGVHRFREGAASASFRSWEPAPGTWPLGRYDAANTAHNPHASPPRSEPAVETVAETAADRPQLVVGPDHLALAGDELTLRSRDGGETVWRDDRPVGVAFGPSDDSRLYGVRVSRIIEHEVLADGREYQLFSVATDGGLSETVHRTTTDDLEGELLPGREEVSVAGYDRVLGSAVDGPRWRVDGRFPALADGWLYTLTSGRREVTAYRQRSGLSRSITAGPERAWRTGVDADLSIDAFDLHLQRPIVSSGRVILGSDGSWERHNAALVALDAATGDPLWEPIQTDRRYVSTPAVVGDVGYVAMGDPAERDGVLAAVDLDSGETLWERPVDGGWMVPSVGGDDTAIVVDTPFDSDDATASTIRAFDTDAGDQLWSVPLDGDLRDAVLVEESVFVTGGGRLYRLHPA